MQREFLRKGNILVTPPHQKKSMAAGIFYTIEKEKGQDQKL